MIRWWRAIGAYGASSDPRMRVANLVALCIVGNQPLYPLYVYWILGHFDHAVLLTWLSTPAFALVPWLGRRDARAGKWLFCVAALGNTGLSVLLEGQASGVALFFVPCALLAVFLLGQRTGVLLALIAAGLGIGLDAVSPSALPQLFRLNAASVITLCGFIALLAYRARSPHIPSARR